MPLDVLCDLVRALPVDLFFGVFVFCISISQDCKQNHCKCCAQSRSRMISRKIRHKGWHCDCAYTVNSVGRVVKGGLFLNKSSRSMYRKTTQRLIEIPRRRRCRTKLEVE